MTKRSLLAWLLVLLGLAAFAQTPLGREVWRLTNEARKAAGLSELAWDDAAYRAARGHARDMLERGYFDHVTPEGLGPAERMWAAGVLEVVVGENLAYYAGVPREEAAARVVEDWLASPPHRKNLLFPDFTHVGIAFVQVGERIAVVQNFLARPFQLWHWATPTQDRVGRLRYEGASRATVGVFVDGVFREALQPPRWQGTLEVRPGSDVSLGLWRESVYVLACRFVLPEVTCGSPKITWKARYEEALEPSVRLQLGLLPGEYVLAYGDPPEPFERVQGDAVIEVPKSWGTVWVGLATGDKIEYTHRIPLGP